MSYTHLSLEEREKGYALREQGLSLREIGRQLGRHHTTLSREYQRNSPEYFPCSAQDRYEEMAAAQRRRPPLKNDLVFDYVIKKLMLGWSPEQIAGRLPLDHSGESIHYETIYRFIYRNPVGWSLKLWQYLKLHRKRRLKRNGRKVKYSPIGAVRVPPTLMRKCTVRKR